MSDSDAWNSGLGSARASTAQQAGAQSGANAELRGDIVVNELAQAFLDEKRRSRRWGIFFKLILLFVFLSLLLSAFASQFVGMAGVGSGRHTALIDISGVIAAGEPANADSIISSLENALQHHGTVGVILRINSPGGSPVQSGVVFDEILRLRNEYPAVPIHAVVGDVCASGGYYIAAAADRIYADKASIIGSIGVRMDSFGFEGTLEKLGVERRLLTSGENKAMLDPFLPVNAAHVQHLKSMLDTIHRQFIDAVRRGRGDRIGNDPELFSGLIWSGEQAVEKGLIDTLANESFVAREVIGAAQIVDFTHREDVFEKLASRIGAAFVHSITGSVIDQSPLPRLR